MVKPGVRTLPFCILFCLSASAQLVQPPQAPVRNPAAGSQAPAGKDAAEAILGDVPATFKVKVNFVSVPVVVRDGQGRTVGDLSAEDFQLFDEGKPQAIARFFMEKSESEVVAGGKQKSGAKKAADATPVLPENYAAYLLDDVQLRASELAPARDAARRHLAASLRPTDRAGIFLTGGERLIDFTDDRSKLNAALLRVRAASTDPPRGCPNVSYYVADLILNRNDTQALQDSIQEAVECLHIDPGPERGSAPQASSYAESAVRGAAAKALAFGEMQTRHSLDSLKRTVRRIALMPGQRNVIFISPGFLLTVNHMQELAEILDSATRSNIVVNVLDARGLYTTGSSAADSPQGTGRSQTQAARLEYQFQGVGGQSDALAQVAAGTGGTFFHNSNDFDQGFRQVAARPEYRYVLGFSPSDLSMDGLFHGLKVTLKSPRGLTLQFRNGYYAMSKNVSPAEEAAQEIQDVLFSRREAQHPAVELETQVNKAGPTGTQLTVFTHFDLKQVRFLKVDGRNVNELAIVSGLFDRNGTCIKVNEQVMRVNLPDEKLAGKRESPASLKTDFDVKPGSYIVRVVVRDAGGQILSAENAGVEIP